jgi:molybdenum cofactor cytidylyltransferase
MGGVKQLLPWRGTTLIRHVVGVAVASGLGPVAVVLGAHGRRITTELAADPVRTLGNDVYARGPGTSVRAAAQWAEESALDALMIILGDQPFVTADDLRALAALVTHRGAALAAVDHDEGPGVPAVFTTAYFAQLRAVPDAAGAKALLRRHARAVAHARMPHAQADLDTPADYQAALVRLRAETALPS